jgi:hypothetical protein
MDSSYILTHRGKDGRSNLQRNTFYKQEIAQLIEIMQLGICSLNSLFFPRAMSSRRAKKLISADL